MMGSVSQDFSAFKQFLVCMCCSAKAEAEQRYMHHHKALTEFEGTHQPKEAEIQRLRQELENHARCAQVTSCMPECLCMICQMSVPPSCAVHPLGAIMQHICMPVQ